MGNPPENQHAVSHKKLAFREHQFWGSSIMNLSSFVTKFKSCRGKLIKIKQNEKSFCEDISQRIEMTLACWTWTIWTMLTTVDFEGICYTSCLPNLATERWIVLLSGILSLSKSLLLCHCVGRTEFVAKCTSMIFVGCCVVNRPVGSILVSKESLRPAVYITWKIWKKIVKHNFGMKNKIGRFFRPLCTKFKNGWHENSYHLMEIGRLVILWPQFILLVIGI